ncbi:hypothetical protein BWQ96_07658 [Gracilariopsis chorda]|uniref:Uncharacterized protein n=1 Tax=Gracilariopsis chorda TaxID=448386 RepID=A0A2V3IKN8_9FLOR|nr:hypothetical protein BWQ96_07658 [Gracilariopsis chorda]|eukprot:PXF42608.1 hypothetical protein BWQ96_07658 [Gracilariopsis chorda]
MSTSKESKHVEYCVEHERQKCRTTNGVIRTDPSHACFICKIPIHSTCGIVPEEPIRNQFAPGAPVEGSGAGVSCSLCHEKVKDRRRRKGAQSYASKEFRIIDHLVPHDVRVFKYSESHERHTTRSFTDRVHYACDPVLNPNPFMEAQKCQRNRLILPADREKDKQKQSGVQEQVSSSSKPFFLSTSTDEAGIVQACNLQGEYRVHTVTDVYEVKRSFHVFKNSKSDRFNGVLFGVEDAGKGNRVLLSAQSALSRVKK